MEAKKMQKAIFVALISVAMIMSIGSVAATLPSLPSYNGIYFSASNHANSATLRAQTYTSDGSYYVIPAGNGLNPIQLSDSSAYKTGDRTGATTSTGSAAGKFWVVFSGGIGHLDDAILMVAVNGSEADLQNFTMHLNSSGYNYTFAAPAHSNPANPAESDIQFSTNRMSDTFNYSDFKYQQSWKPANTANYSIYYGEDNNAASNQFHIMFIDLNSSAFVTGAYSSEVDDGSIGVDYNITGLPAGSVAVFNVYGWFTACNWGTGIPQTSNIAQSSYNVTST